MKRTPLQNRRIQGYCRTLARSAKILVNGAPIYLNHEDMRHYLCAAWKKEAKRLALSPEGDAVILLGASTRELTEEEAADFTQYIKWYAATRNPPILLIDPREPEGRT